MVKNRGLLESAMSVLQLAINTGAASKLAIDQDIRSKPGFMGRL
jgi:hypothetical protein